MLEKRKENFGGKMRILTSSKFPPGPFSLALHRKLFGPLHEIYIKGSQPTKDPIGLRSCEIRQAFSWLNRV